MDLDTTKISKLKVPLFSTRVEEDACTLHSFSDLQPFIEYALTSTLVLIQAQSGSLFLWDESSKELVLKTSRNQKNIHNQDIRLKLREGISGTVAERGCSVLVTDIHRDGRFCKVHRNGTYRTSSFICLPLIARNKLLGIINITEKNNQDSFTESERARAEAYARHVALAYDNLRLRRRLQDENQVLAMNLQDLKETLKRQESLVSIGKLAANLSHELSNPLDAIRRFVNLALDEVMEDSLPREYLLKAKKGIRRAVQVIRGLLQFSRDASGLPQKTSEIHELIDQSLEVFRHDTKYEQIQIQKDFDESKFYVKDCGLHMVFKNLFENAAHAMNGTVEKPKGLLKIATKYDQSQVWIAVRDTGCGIPSNIRSHIFEPFFTTKQKEGTGIGLAICKDIVERCGGQIALSSETAQGTEFIISLPVWDGNGHSSPS